MDVLVAGSLRAGVVLLRVLLVPDVTESSLTAYFRFLVVISPDEVPVISAFRSPTGFWISAFRDVKCFLLL